MSLIEQKNILSTELEAQQLGQSWIKPKNKKGEKNLVIGLTLTSLVDCFTVLIVYLLMTTTIGQEPIDINKSVELPETRYSQTLDSGPTVIVNSKGLIFEKKTYSFSQGQAIVQKILNSSKNIKEITLQADRDILYNQINSVVYNLMQAGVGKVKLAVYSNPNEGVN